jgi:DNA-binding transcriptional MocR family regulator
VSSFFLQPRAHNPTGASLAPARVAELVDVLSGRDAVVVEDDSAGAIATTAAASLGGALPTRTLHVRSFSKSHGPDLRLAAASGPAEIVEPMVERRFLGQGWSSRLLQALLVDLLVHPDAVAQVARARREYARRRSAVVGGLRARGVEVPTGDGLNLWLPVTDEAAAMVSLATEGVRVAAGGPFVIGTRRDPHVRVTVGLARSGHDELADQLARAAAAGATRARG